MRIRQVKPAFWGDAKMRGLPFEARLLYIGLWQEADDAGWLRWDPEQLALDLLPFEGWEQGERIISEVGLLLSGRGRLRIFKCGHAFIPKLVDHQRFAAPEKRVYTIYREHQEHSKHKPAGARGSPHIPGTVRSGQVRSGQVRSIARAREEEIERALNGG